MRTVDFFKGYDCEMIGRLVKEITNEIDELFDCFVLDLDVEQSYNSLDHFVDKVFLTSSQNNDKSSLDIIMNSIEDERLKDKMYGFAIGYITRIYYTK